MQRGGGRRLRTALAGRELGRVGQQQGAAGIDVERVGIQGGGDGLEHAVGAGLVLPQQAELAHGVHRDDLGGRHLAADGGTATRVDDDVARRDRVGRTKAAAPGDLVKGYLGDQLHLGGIDRLLTPDGHALHVFDLHHLGAGLVDGHVVVIVLRLGAQVVAQLDALVIQRAPFGGPPVLVIVKVFIAIAVSFVAHGIVVPVVAIDRSVIPNPSVATGHRQLRPAEIVVPEEIHQGSLWTKPNRAHLVVIPAQAASLIPVGIVAPATKGAMLIKIRATPKILETRCIAYVDTVLGGGRARDVCDRLGVVAQLPKVGTRCRDGVGSAQTIGGWGHCIKPNGEVGVALRVCNHPIDFGKDAVKADDAIALPHADECTTFPFNERAVTPSGRESPGDHIKVFVTKP